MEPTPLPKPKPKSKPNAIPATGSGKNPKKVKLPSFDLSALTSRLKDFGERLLSALPRDPKKRLAAGIALVVFVLVFVYMLSRGTSETPSATPSAETDVTPVTATTPTPTTAPEPTQPTSTAPETTPTTSTASPPTTTPTTAEPSPTTPPTTAPSTDVSTTSPTVDPVVVVDLGSDCRRPRFPEPLLGIINEPGNPYFADHTEKRERALSITRAYLTALNEEKIDEAMALISDDFLAKDQKLDYASLKTKQEGLFKAYDLKYATSRIDVVRLEEDSVSVRAITSTYKIVGDNKFRDRIVDEVYTISKVKTEATPSTTTPTETSSSPESTPTTPSPPTTPNESLTEKATSTDKETEISKDLKESTETWKITEISTRSLRYLN